MKRINDLQGGMLQDRRGQLAVWGFLCMLIFIALCAGLVDIYRLYAARNWAYTLAQEAALSGVSNGRDWLAVLAQGELCLDAHTAKNETEQVITAEMNARGISGYRVLVQVLPNPDGGVVPGFPPRAVRLGSGMGDWSSDEPAVGVYLEVPVSWVLMDLLHVADKSVHVFAAAGVAQ